MEFLKIGKIFSQDYYAIPDYQRDYEWTNAQNSTLIDDVFSIISDNSGNRNHFFGAIVTIPYEETNGTNKSIDFDDYEISSADNIKHVVDGQQRLTSFSILIKALLDSIQDDSDVSLSYKSSSKRQLDNILLGNAYCGSYAAPHLILNGNTGNFFNNVILNVSDKSYSKLFKGAKRISAAYSLFSTEISTRKKEMIDDNTCKNSEEYYKKLVDTITKKVVFVEIACDASSDAFQVFDSLNGKGLDLTAADRIKNIFMSWNPNGSGAQKWDALVSDIGDDNLASFFVSVFFYHCEKRISKNKLPEEFKITYRDGAQGDFNYFYSTLRETGKLFGEIRQHKTNNSNLNEILQDFEALGFEQVYSMLFAAAFHYGNDIVNTQDYTDFANKIMNLVVRMQVCEKSMNKLDRIFSSCIKEMKKGSSSISIIMNKIDDELRLSVDDDQFKQAFTLFNPKENKTAEFYLRHIEDYIRKQNGDRTSVGRSLTVEHVIPQTLDDLKVWYGDEVVPEEIANDFQSSVVENIGNKCLLYSDDNTSASNNNYQTKLVVYRNGITGRDDGCPINTFKLVSELVSDYPTKFTHTEVFKRAGKLAEYAVNIWK